MENKKFRLKRNEIQALRELKDFLKREFPGSKIIIFGSRARGEGDEESDIDILILTPGKTDRRGRKNIIHFIFELNLRTGANISPIICSEKEWEEGVFSVLPIKNYIKEEGIKL